MHIINTHFDSLSHLRLSRVNIGVEKDDSEEEQEQEEFKSALWSMRFPALCMLQIGYWHQPLFKSQEVAKFLIAHVQTMELFSFTYVIEAAFHFREETKMGIALDPTNSYDMNSPKLRIQSIYGASLAICFLLNKYQNLRRSLQYVKYTHAIWSHMHQPPSYGQIASDLMRPMHETEKGEETLALPSVKEFCVNFDYRCYFNPQALNGIELDKDWKDFQTDLCDVSIPTFAETFPNLEVWSGCLPNITDISTEKLAKAFGHLRNLRSMELCAVAAGSLVNVESHLTAIANACPLLEVVTFVSNNYTHMCPERLERDAISFAFARNSNKAIMVSRTHVRLTASAIRCHPQQFYHGGDY